MHNRLITLLAILLCITLSSTVMALNPIVDYAIFQNPEGESYVETYLLIPSDGVTFAKNASDKYQASVEVTLLFKQGEKIAAFDKYLLSSKEVENDSTAIDFNLIDLKRMPLDAGDYTLEIDFKDMNKETAPVHYESKVTIAPTADELIVSDIVFVDTYQETESDNIYSKMGYDLIPNVARYYPPKTEKLTFYSEIYNADKALEDDAFLTIYAVKKAGSNEIVQKLRKFKKQQTKSVNVLLAELNIADLPSGNYDLAIEVRNKKNELLAAKTAIFQRNRKKDELNAETLKDTNIEGTFVTNLKDEEVAFYLGSLYPIAVPQQRGYVSTLVKSENYHLMRQFLYRFWQIQNPMDPEGEFSAYRQVVDEVEKAYSSQIKHGYDTDRGRVYLQYGPPNFIRTESQEPSALPYEVWQYYKLVGHSGMVIFVFVNAELVGQDYRLIHSTARGEVRDEQWRARVFNDAKPIVTEGTPNSKSVIQHYGTSIGRERD